MTYVYVQNKDGKPLPPTTRCGHVRILLKEGRAVVSKGRPFTIRLLYETDTDPVIPDLYGGTDPGRTNIGNAVINENSDCYYLDKVKTRNSDVPKLMSARKAHRQARRRGERLVRKRLAKKHNTFSTKLENGRLIPGTKKPTAVKDIINQEARFQNRKKNQLLCPTAKHLIDTTLHQIDQIREILPVKGWALEANKFAFMKMKDGTVQGIDFQNGRLKGYASADEFVYERQNGRCFCCGRPIEHYHHVKPRSEGGSDGPENKIGVCNSCHSRIHTNDLELDVRGYNKKYGAVSILNQAIPYIYLGLVERFGEENVFICSGRDTRDIREAAGLEKDHDIDALCIASIATGILPEKPDIAAYTVKQYRRHDRARINAQTERTYKFHGTTVAKNRKPRYKQEGPALSDWYKEQIDIFGKKEANRRLSRLTVKRSYRRYNNLNRLMPGAVFRHSGRIYVFRSQKNNGDYIFAEGKKHYFKAADCEILMHNTGLVYL